MASCGNGSTVGYENGQPFYDHNLIYGPLQPSCMDQCNGQILQQQQSGQHEDTNRFQSHYSLSIQGTQAASRTQSFWQEQLVQPENTIESLLQGHWISQRQGSQLPMNQDLGQSPHSQGINEKEAAKRLRKREVDKAYRQREKLKKLALVDENDQLRRAIEAANGRLMSEIEEKEKLKSNVEALEAEILRLKPEILQHEQLWMDKLQDEVNRLNGELESEKRKNVLLNEMLETLSTEMDERRSQCPEMTQQNMPKTREEDMVIKDGNGFLWEWSPSPSLPIEIPAKISHGGENMSLSSSPRTKPDLCGESVSPPKS